MIDLIKNPGNTGEAILTSDSEFEEDEAEEREAEILQARQMDRMQEEDFLDTFVVKENKETEVLNLVPTCKAYYI